MLITKRIQIILRIVLLVGTMISMFFVPWILVKAWLTPLPDTVQDQVNEAIGLGFDGMIVYVDQAGKEPAFYASGWKDRENQIPADPHSLFKIASIGKLYDAVAVTKLVSKHRLSLEKTLPDYLPELEGRIENAEKITLRMMVQHRSGIPNYTNHPGYWDNPRQSSKEILALVLDLPAEFKPDEKYMYSNTNYLLISEIVEKELGYSKFQYIKDEILTHLGLKNTFGSIRDVKMEDVMSGYYDINIDQDIKTTNYGSMVATAEDVGIFLRALNDGSLFDEDEKEIYSSLYEYDHTGWIPGYQSIARYYKDIDTVVIQFMNTTGGYNWNSGEIVHSRIISILRKEIN